MPNGPILRATRDATHIELNAPPIGATVGPYKSFSSRLPKPRARSGYGGRAVLFPLTTSSTHRGGGHMDFGDWTLRACGDTSEFNKLLLGLRRLGLRFTAWEHDFRKTGRLLPAPLVFGRLH